MISIKGKAEFKKVDNIIFLKLPEEAETLEKYMQGEFYCDVELGREITIKLVKKVE